MPSDSQIFVKICGLRDAASARVAVDAGADALGFILAPSKRQVSSDAVATIQRQIPDRLQRPSIVGVTVNANPEEIGECVEKGLLDAIQLSGHENPDILSLIDVPVIKVLRFRGGMSVDEACREIDRWLAGPRAASQVIVEGHTEGAFGGTGTRADWKFVAKIAMRYPIILAGGLTPDNVPEAIAAVDPCGVDVSSGTETDGVKDHRKIRAFVERSREAVSLGS